MIAPTQRTLPERSGFIRHSVRGVNTADLAYPIAASAAWLADLWTGLLLPPGAERNPAAAVLLGIPLLALAAKSAALSLAVNAARYHRVVLGVVTGAGLVGFASNLRAL